MTLFKEAADIKTSDQLNLPTPTPIYHNVVAQPTEIQESMVQELSERAAKVHAGIVDASVDNMLKITSDGRKLGLDQRVINPDLPDDPGSKVNQCVDNIYRIWDEGQSEKLTQLVFSDLSTPKTAPTKRAAKATAGNLDSPELHALEQLNQDDDTETPFSVYDDIREKLVARGVPREQIAFIHGCWRSFIFFDSGSRTQFTDKSHTRRRRFFGTARLFFCPFQKGGRRSWQQHALFPCTTIKEKR